MLVRRYLIFVFALIASVPSLTARAAEPVTPSPAGLPTEDDRRAAAVLATLKEQAGEYKMINGWSMIIVGGTLTAAGVFVESRYEASYGSTVALLGVAGIGAGIGTLLSRPAIASFADEVGSSPLGLEERWRAKAAEAKSRRVTTGIVSLGVGVVGAAGAAILAAGVGDLSREDRSQWVSLSAIWGGAGFASGLSSLLIESDIEKGYAVAYPDEATAAITVEVGIAPLPMGGALQVQGAF